MADRLESGEPEGYEFLSSSEVLGYLSFILVMATITHVSDLSVGLAVLATLLVMAAWMISGIVFEESADDDQETPRQGGMTGATFSRFSSAMLFPKIVSCAGILLGATCTIAGISWMNLPFIGLGTLCLLGVWILGLDRTP